MLLIEIMLSVTCDYRPAAFSVSSFHVLSLPWPRMTHLLAVMCVNRWGGTFWSTAAVWSDERTDEQGDWLTLCRLATASGPILRENGHNGPSHAMRSECLDSFVCSDITQVFGLCFFHLSLAHLLWATAVRGSFFSFSVLVWLIWFVRDQKKGLLLFAWWNDRIFLFFFLHSLQSWSFYLYTAQLLVQQGWYVSGRALIYWKTTSKACSFEKEN